MRKARIILIGVAVLLLLVLVANQSLIDLLKEEDPLVPERDSNQDSATSDLRDNLADSSTLIDFEELVGLEPDELLGATNQLDESEVFAKISQVLKFWTRRVEVDPLKYPVGSPGILMFSEESDKVGPLLNALLLSGEGELALRLAETISEFPGAGESDRPNYERLASSASASLGLNAFSMGMQPEEIASLLDTIEISPIYAANFAGVYLGKLAETDPIAAAEWAVGLPEEVSSLALSSVVSRWIIRDGGDKAINFLVNVPSEINIDQPLGMIAEQHKDNEPFIRSLLDTIESDQLKDKIRYNQTNHSLKSGDPEKAFSWALTIKEEQVRSTRLDESFEQWYDKEGQVALDYLIVSDQLRNDERQRLAQRIANRP